MSYKKPDKLENAAKLSRQGGVLTTNAPQNNRVRRDNNHPPVADPRTPQASHRWVFFFGSEVSA